LVLDSILDHITPDDKNATWVKDAMQTNVDKIFRRHR
jgi:hypothetical protein